MRSIPTSFQRRVGGAAGSTTNFGDGEITMMIGQHRKQGRVSNTAMKAGGIQLRVHASISTSFSTRM